MIDNRYFKKHKTRLALEGAVTATMSGLTIGFTIAFFVALATWIFDFGSIWLAIGSGLGVAASTAVLLYFKKYKPTDNDIARRVDRLGLEERLITMMEFKDDDSYIARLQRENAEEHVKYVEGRRIKIRIPTFLATLTLVSFMLSATMTTVSGLADNNIIPSGGDLIFPEDPFENFIAISYVVEEGGEIIGDADQLIAPGEDGTPVVAVAEDGWVFVGWDDDLEDPERTERDVTEDMVFTALFEEIGDEASGSGGDASDSPEGEDGEGDQASDAPDNENASSGEGDPGDAGGDSSGEGSEGETDQNGNTGGESQNGGEGEGGQGASGKFDGSNQFYDGNTYYRDQLDMYYEMAQDIFAADGSIPPEFIEFFESYYNSI